MGDVTYRDEYPIEDVVVDILAAKHLTVSTAESCTGGLLAGRIINVPGASDVIGEGFITYSNDAKRKYLGVKKSTLKKYGAVSKQCAKEMAKGLLDATKADVGLVTTGIAGPAGGTEEKPVGLVYIGCNVCGKIKVKKYIFEGDRRQIRESAAQKALILARKCLIKYKMENDKNE
ncbi:MAG: CinA family protein [Lachnospiraceae bacterium]|jgi:nicotinamide-nucleotide amidase|nr:CinA family protein [Lachnospiraceae bacterium]MBQ6319122.1 CinA family protein [Lachnospiraceae bacterium]MBQ8007813.1 CinA family protein [Lachnospiraceae bacterium]MBQ8666610.1 CinA family protein [Lachnospiraceae bacterium]